MAVVPDEQAATTPTSCIGRMTPASDLRLLTMVRHDQLPRLLERMLDENEFLSDHGLRALSRAHLDQPFTVRLGETDYSVGYEPANRARRCSAATPTGAARSGSR